MKRLTAVTAALVAIGLGSAAPAVQAHYSSSARQLCQAERIQLGPRAFDRRYGGRSSLWAYGAMWRCIHSHSSAHQASSSA